MEAPSAVDAVSRLREVVGTDTDVLFVVPAVITEDTQDVSYEAFLTDPDAQQPSA